MKPKVIVFDFWQTLISGADSKTVDKISRKLSFRSAKELWKYFDQNIFDKMMSMEDAFIHILNLKSPRKNILEEISKLWKDSWKDVKLFSDVIPTLSKLKRKYKLAILSNTTYDEFQTADETFKITQYFEEVILSCSVGLAKPDPRLFKLVLDRFHVKPSEVLLIGDDLENDIIPARSIGFNAILVDRKNKYLEYEGEKWYIKSLEELKIGD